MSEWSLYTIMQIFVKISFMSSWNLLSFLSCLTLHTICNLNILPYLTVFNKSPPILFVTLRITKASQSNRDFFHLIPKKNNVQISSWLMQISLHFIISINLHLIFTLKCAIKGDSITVQFDNHTNHH